MYRKDGRCRYGGYSETSSRIYGDRSEKASFASESVDYIKII